MAKDILNTMETVILTGHSGLEKLEYRSDVAVPKPAENEYLIRVVVAGINNTDINALTAWYSKLIAT